MNCTPAPTITCGDTIYDACINISGTWPACFPTTAGSCYRQSDFNLATSNLLCSLGNVVAGSNPITLPIALPTGVTSILSSITLSSLTGCALGLSPNQVHITPIGTTVVAELQNIYNILCDNLPINLTTPLTLSPSPNGLSLGCLQAPCGVPIGTLGGLLQALVNAVCDSPTLVYKATLTQATTNAPIATILEDTFDPGSALNWTYISAGTYRLTAGIGSPFATASRVEVIIGTAGFGNHVTASVTSGNTVTVNSGVLSTLTLTNGLLNNTFIQVKAY